MPVRRSASRRCCFDLVFKSSFPRKARNTADLQRYVTGHVVVPPSCGTTKAEIMRTDACQYFYECTGCGELLRRRSGDCCVFCSYGSVAYPPIQACALPTRSPVRE